MVAALAGAVIVTVIMVVSGIGTLEQTPKSVLGGAGATASHLIASYYESDSSDDEGMPGGSLLIAAFLGLIPASIASSKGRNFAAWWFYGWMLFIVALIHSLVMKSNKPEDQAQVD